MWVEQAIRQLDQAYDYIAFTNSEAVAARITAHILASVERLSAFPLLGRRGRVSGTRELIVSNAPFIVAYILEDRRIVILAVYHSARRRFSLRNCGLDSPPVFSSASAR